MLLTRVKGYWGELYVDVDVDVDAQFPIFFLCHPTPLRTQAFVAMQSIMLAMGSVGQMMLAYAIRVEMKHLERSYSTLCCSVSDIFSFVTPPPTKE